MAKHIIIFLMALISAATAKAQDTQVQNRPYTDLRPFISECS